MIMNPEHYVFGRIPKKLKKHKLKYCKLKTEVIKMETEISNCYSEIHDFYKEVLLYFFLFVNVQLYYTIWLE